MKIGINAMSSIAAMHNDLEGCLKRLKESGCDMIEGMSDWGATRETIDFFAGMMPCESGWDPVNAVKRVKKIREYGMTMDGMFVFEELLVEQAEELGQYCVDNDIHYLVLSFLEYTGIDDIYSKIDLIKTVSSMMKPYHVQILLHNHEHDSNTIQDKDGKEKPILQIFLEQCTPEELMMEIDTGWLLYAGVDEAAYVSEYLDRIAVLHLKDINRNYKTMPRDKVFLACGRGAVNFPGIIEAAKSREDMLYVIDQDNSQGDIMDDLVESVRYIRGLLEQVSKTNEHGGEPHRHMPMPPHPPKPDFSDSNMLTRRYLDSLYIEERLIGAKLSDIHCEIFGKTYDSPIMMPAFSHLDVMGEGRRTGMEEYSLAAKNLNILNWVGMMDNDRYLTIEACGADTVRIIKPYADHAKILDQIQFAESHGAVAVGIDIDHVFDMKGNYDIVVGEPMDSVSMDDLKTYVGSTALPFVIKGVLSISDALACAEAGVKGIVVSHHHGRMPFAMPPLAVLPEIKKALEGTGIQIFVDCGIASGADVFKALMLGADAVSVGRAMLPGLTKDGEQGVIRKITEMNEELKGFMNFTGCADLGHKDPTVIHRGILEK